MSFQPVIPMTGYTGWRFLQRTIDNQAAQHASTPVAQRDEAYFRDNIGKIDSAADLVADRRLLQVALTAFGLADDLPNHAYIQRVLESSLDEPRSFANRLSDKRYAELAKAFGFAAADGPKTAKPGFADKIIADFHDRRFELAVGEQDQTMRLALALQRELAELATSDRSDEAKWLRVLGTPNLRMVFESAFQLPKEFGKIDLDRQVSILSDRTQRLFGEGGLAQFADPDKMAALTRRYFVGEQLREIQSQTGPSAALTLLMDGQASFARFRQG
ncbi:DUF1217 domain-containing protein [Pararhodobacter sp. SW119]|uniref:DUF1217 domain-containing protein n=1 Tax=Pararhodobacter sp. SW119 TaxID=2780075 RepID=UPI001AE06253|nr:DUF1217 domain-containing protein [Pararhodobacter sp. SW119]